MANLSNPLLYRINYHWQTNTQVNLKNHLGCKLSNKKRHMWSCWKQFFFQPKGTQENMFAFEVLSWLGMDPVFKGRMSVIDSAFLSSYSFLKSIPTFWLHTTQQSLAANWPKVVPTKGTGDAVHVHLPWVWMAWSLLSFLSTVFVVYRALPWVYKF